MSDVADDKEFQQRVVRYLLPGDVQALLRFAELMESINGAATRSKEGRFLSRLVAGTGTGIAGRLATDAARILNSSAQRP
jgi:hypothetical protein